MLASSLLAVRALARETAGKGEVFEPEWKRYSDPDTELDVYRLTDPSYSSKLPDSYNRIISRNSASLIFSCDRAGAPDAYRMDLKTGATRRLTQCQDLDGGSLNLTPDNRSICYFAGRTLCLTSLSNLKEREIYTVPDGWERTRGMTVSTNGAGVYFAEHRGAGSRLRMAAFTHGSVRTVIEVPFSISAPIERPLRGQILYRDPGNGLWLTDLDGRHNRRLKLAAGGLGPANWAPGGRTILYLNFPEDRHQLNAIREYTPDSDTDKLVAPTSQYVDFGFNRDTSVFVGASRNAGSPVILIMLRITRRELTLCEHKASHPETVEPMFAPDAQRIYFQSDRDGKPALYALHVEKLVDKIQVDKE
jgi:oligogalacturonide lyase